MLGIGFIITHFVAMQKPQQRKYHSSCNRSVHRGTAHGKQEVKVCKRKTPHLFLMRSFLSPYGDGTTFKVNDVFTTLFSPPYGDSTACLMCFMAGCCFSPPYGDGTPLFDNTRKATTFSPPYGDKLKYIMARPKGSKNMFPSPCGDKLKWAFNLSPQGDGNIFLLPLGPLAGIS